MNYLGFTVAKHRGFYLKNNNFIGRFLVDIILPAGFYPAPSPL